MAEETDGVQTTKDEADNDAISRAFLGASGPMAIAPTFCNRFQMYQGPAAGTAVMVIGSGAMGQLIESGVPKGRQPLVAIAGSFAFNREFAMDLAIFLERHFSVTAEERAEREKRYPGKGVSDLTEDTDV